MIGLPAWIPAELADRIFFQLVGCDAKQSRAVLCRSFRFAAVTIANLDGLSQIDVALISLASISTLTRLSLRHCRPSDNALASLGYLPHLTELVLSDTGLRSVDTIAGCGGLCALDVSDNHALCDFAALSKLVLLESLSLAATGITNEELFVVQCLTRLRTLHLCATTLTDDALPALEPLNLSFLDISMSAAITNEGLQWVSHIASLQTLIATWTATTSAALEQCVKLTNLTSLRCSFSDRPTSLLMNCLVLLTRLTDLQLHGAANLSAIAACNQLTTLSVPEADCENDCQFPIRLTVLILDASTISDETCICISKLACLQVLHLANTRISDDGLQHLVLLPMLRELSISRNTLRNFSVLENFPALRTLNVSYVKCDQWNFSASAFLCLTDINVSHSNIEDAPLCALWDLPSLARIELSSDLRVKRTTLAHLGLNPDIAPSHIAPSALRALSLSSPSFPLTLPTSCGGWLSAPRFRYSAAQLLEIRSMMHQDR